MALFTFGIFTKNRIPHNDSHDPLSIKRNEENERFFERLCKVVSRESCRLVPKVNGKK